MITLKDLQDQPKPEGTGDYQPLPAGTYSVEITGVEQRQTGSGDNALSFQFSVTGDKYNNRRVSTLLNLRHSTSEQAREIALGELYDIHEAAGLDEIQDDAEMLIGAPMEIDVTVEDHWDTEKAEAGEKINKIKRYGKLNGKQESAAPFTTKKPWEK